MIIDEEYPGRADDFQEENDNSQQNENVVDGVQSPEDENSLDEQTLEVSIDYGNGEVIETLKPDELVEMLKQRKQYEQYNQEINDFRKVSDTIRNSNLLQELVAYGMQGYPDSVLIAQISKHLGQSKQEQQAEAEPTFDDPEKAMEYRFEKKYQEKFASLEERQKKLESQTFITQVQNINNEGLSKALIKYGINDNNASSHQKGIAKINDVMKVMYPGFNPKEKPLTQEQWEGILSIALTGSSQKSMTTKIETRNGRPLINSRASQRYTPNKEEDIPSTPLSRGNNFSKFMNSLRGANNG